LFCSKFLPWLGWQIYVNQNTTLEEDQVDQVGLVATVPASETTESQTVPSDIEAVADIRDAAWLGLPMRGILRDLVRDRQDQHLLHSRHGGR